MAGTVLELVEDDKLQTVIVVTTLLVLWGFLYIYMINRRLFSFFPETNFYNAMGVLLGALMSQSTPVRNVMYFFLCFDNYDQNILIFSILYPVSKLCTHVYGDNLPNSLLEAVFITGISIIVHAAGLFAVLFFMPNLVAPGAQHETYRHLLFSIFVSACGCAFDPYMAVHNVPEVRASSFLRGYLMSQRVFTLCFALEIRRLTIRLAMYTEITWEGLLLIVTKNLVYIPVESLLVGVIAGLVATFITKHSEPLHIQQDVVVMPCTNYLVYIAASRFGLSAAWSVLACEFTMGKLTLKNIDSGSRATYKALLGNVTKWTVFFYFMATGFFIGAPENRFVWKYVSVALFFAAFVATVVIKVVVCAVISWIQRYCMGRSFPEKTMKFQSALHTRSTPCMISLFNMQHFSAPFGVCLAQMLSIQYTLYLVCVMVNLVNVPLVTKQLELLLGTSGAKPGSCHGVLRSVADQMMEELNHQVRMFAGDDRWTPAYMQQLSRNIEQHLLANLMVHPQDTSSIMSAYKADVTSRSNFIDQLRQSVKSRARIQATQVCAHFFIMNLMKEGFTFEEIFNYF